MNQEVLHEQVAAYLQGSLPTTERKELESLFHTNPEAQQELLDQQLVCELAEFAIAQDLREKFRNTPVNTAEPKIRTLPVRRWASIAAAVSLLLIAAIGFYANQNYSANHIASAYSKEINILSGQRSGTDQQHHPRYSQGEQAYAKEDFALALEYFSTVPANDANYFDAIYNVGAIAFYTGDYPAAIKAFETYLKGQQNTRTVQSAEWYLLLSLIGNDAPDEAIRAGMNQILNNPGHDYHQKALELDRKMNSFFFRILN